MNNPQTPVINPEVNESLASYRDQFANASPFRHVLIKDFLSTEFLKTIKSEFPEPKEKDMVSEFGDKSLKHTVEGIRGLGPTFQRWDDTLKSGDFIKLIEEITGVKGLIFDPEYVGAGTHNNLHGQSLDLHIDFNYHATTRFHRRLNLIIYLCEEWDPSWGGCLELHKDAWDRDCTDVVSYPPYENHAVIFETNEHSWHGFEQICLPEDKRHLSRKSLTVYYYSEDRPDEETFSDHSTVYVPQGLPKDIKPGETLSQAQYDALRAMVTRRDHYLQRLYEREAQIRRDYLALAAWLHPISRAVTKMGLVGVARKVKQIMYGGKLPR